MQCTKFETKSADHYCLTVASILDVLSWWKILLRVTPLQSRDPHAKLAAITFPARRKCTSFNIKSVGPHKKASWSIVTGLLFIENDTTQSWYQCIYRVQLNADIMLYYLRNRNTNTENNKFSGLKENKNNNHWVYLQDLFIGTRSLFFGMLIEQQTLERRESSVVVLLWVNVLVQKFQALALYLISSQCYFLKMRVLLNELYLTIQEEKTDFRVVINYEIGDIYWHRQPPTCMKTN